VIFIRLPPRVLGASYGVSIAFRKAAAFAPPDAVASIRIPQIPLDRTPTSSNGTSSGAEAALAFAPIP
jgi:hypothetical protein